MTPENKKSLAKTVQSIRSANVPEWDRFIDALEARSFSIINELVASTPDRLQFNQGRAYEVRDFIHELKNAPRLADALYEQGRK